MKAIRPAFFFRGFDFGQRLLTLVRGIHFELCRVLWFGRLAKKFFHHAGDRRAAWGQTGAEDFAEILVDRRIVVHHQDSSGQRVRVNVHAGWS